MQGFVELIFRLLLLKKIIIYYQNDKSNPFECIRYNILFLPFSLMNAYNAKAFAATVVFDIIESDLCGRTMCIR